jgi:hypothetical protein
MAAATNLAHFVDNGLKILGCPEHEGIYSHGCLLSLADLLEMLEVRTGLFHFVSHSWLKFSWCGATVLSLSSMKNFPPGAAMLES